MPSKICQENRIHFIGIGGIGVSALAQYYLAMDCKVSGSDLSRSEITDYLQKLGADVFVGKHIARNFVRSNSKFKMQNAKLQSTIKNYQNLAELVIYSPAVATDNLELQEARRLGIKCQSYPEALGELTKKYFTIAVSGTHGKSTTTAMIALILIKSGLDPTVILGTKLKEFDNSNFRFGKTKNYKPKTKNYLVIEADEHMASFLHYWPKIIVLTNIEKDHLDYYKNLKNILKTFKRYIQHLPKDGALVANGDDSRIQRMLNSKLKMQNAKRQCKIKNYYLKQPEEKILKKILQIPGEHNVSNALAALTTARVLKIPDKISFKALSEYKGSWRRFEEHELKIENCKLKIVIDYAHHPTEILATLKAAREKYPKRRIWCVYQPHQYQRTHYLFKDFVEVFSAALADGLIDKLILAEIYDVAGREESIISSNVSSKILAEEISRKSKNAIYIKNINQISGYIKKYAKNNDAIIVMGAGDVYKLVEQLNKKQ